MRTYAHLRPAFGVALLVISQGCGCWELKAVLGCLELGVIDGRWCRNKNNEQQAVDSSIGVSPIEGILANLRAVGIPEWKIATLRDDLQRIMELPPTERLAAMHTLLEDLQPGITGGTPPSDTPAPLVSGDDPMLGRVCETCGGRGHLQRASHGPSLARIGDDCPTCQGTGHIAPPTGPEAT